MQPDISQDPQNLYMYMQALQQEILWSYCFWAIKYQDTVYIFLTLLHSELPKLHWVLAILNAIG